ncbi:myozenin-2-like [Sinocyclocheilus grahami]|uniref:myozenin-2-like n=1 Tax=Sinocyclocheilus grahami TaxID=75366 RepID=UPI0007AD0C0C|nr:PREDICTED: myozenin-2-like [Sinocyclocheilus grahami]
MSQFSTLSVRERKKQAAALCHEVHGANGITFCQNLLSHQHCKLLFFAGYGGPLINIPPERFNATAVPKSYHSPWEEVINKVATPYGGFDKTPRGITFKLPEVDLNAPRYPELQDPAAKRPIFNRTAQGWISNGTPLILPSVSLEPFEIPESDDL